MPRFKNGRFRKRGDKRAKGGRKATRRSRRSSVTTARKGGRLPRKGRK